MIAVELLRARRAKTAPPEPSTTPHDAGYRDAAIAPAVVVAPGLVGLEHVTPWRAFVIGLGQCVSMWPGSSRSMCTIVTGQLTGLSTATAAEFSFLLGLPTLGAATVYEAYKSRGVLGEIGALNVGIGLVVSFIVAWAVIAAFLAYLKRYGLLPFGVYRIILGILVFALLMR
jgi:undecaprenyl-diphosphatase